MRSTTGGEPLLRARNATDGRTRAPALRDDREPFALRCDLWEPCFVMLAGMTRDLLRKGEGRFYRGNLHCHSDRSDGKASPEAVARAYRDAGYDFICLSDHFEARYGWSVTDTRELGTPTFATIIGAELSSTAWEERTVFWVVAAGLPVDFEPPPGDDHAEASHGRAKLARS